MWGRDSTENRVSVDTATHQWAHRGVGRGKGDHLQWPSVPGTASSWTRFCPICCAPLILAAVFHDLQGPGEVWVTALSPPKPLQLPDPAAGG